MFRDSQEGWNIFANASKSPAVLKVLIRWQTGEATSRNTQAPFITAKCRW